MTQAVPASIAAELYRALSNKPCACTYHWTKQGYEVNVPCQGHRAMTLYEQHLAL